MDKRDLIVSKIGEAVEKGKTFGEIGWDTIIHELDGYDCAKEIFNQLPTLTNDIAKLLQETFGVNNDINVTFYADDGLKGTDTDGTNRTLNATKSSDGEVFFSGEIGLNPDILNNSTQEYILVTMYHEVIHAFLDYEQARLRKILPNGEFDNSLFLQKYPSVKEYWLSIGAGDQKKRYVFIQEAKHNQFHTFIEKLANSILSFNPNFSIETARAMAKMGIVEKSSLSEKEKLLNQNQRNATDPKGTKCKK